MTEPSDLHRSLMTLLRQRHLSASAAERALVLAQVLPGKAQWRWFLMRLFLFGGTLACAAAVIFFVAHNWGGWPRLVRFGVLQMLVILALLPALVLGTRHLGGRAALLGAMLACGALIAYFGQTYQTGADSYKLFQTWAFLIAPWVLISRSRAAWGLWLLLLNLAVQLYAGRLSGSPLAALFDAGNPAPLLFCLNASAVLASELVTRFQGAGASRALPRFAALLLLGCIGFSLANWILGAEHTDFASWSGLTRLAMLAVLPGLFGLYMRLRDVALLVAVCLTAIFLATCGLIRIVFDFSHEPAGFLLVGGFLILASATVAVLLRRLQARWSGGA